MKREDMTSRSQWLKYRQGIKERWGQWWREVLEWQLCHGESSQSRLEQKEKGFRKEHSNEQKNHDRFMMHLSILRGVLWFCCKDWGWFDEGHLENNQNVQMEKYSLQRRHTLHKLENAIVVHGSTVNNINKIIRMPTQNTNWTKASNKSIRNALHKEGWKCPPRYQALLPETCVSSFEKRKKKKYLLKWLH